MAGGARFCYHGFSFPACFNCIFCLHQHINGCTVAIMFQMCPFASRYTAMCFQANQHFIPRKYDFVCLHLISALLIKLPLINRVKTVPEGLSVMILTIV